jgi:glycosyltransferase involved in cell wall biosynthesis
MKICYLANAESIHIQRWVKYFAENGHEVHLISPRSFGNKSIKNVKLYLVKELHSQIRSIRFIFFPMNLLLGIIQVKELIKKIKPDIVHAHYIGEYGLHGALACSQPFIVSAWGSDVLRAPKKSKLSKYTVPYAIKKADVITTTAEFMKEYLIRTFNVPGGKIIRIPWGIDLKIFHRGYEEGVERLKESLGIGANSPIILSNRHMDQKYEIQSIIDSIPYVTKKYPNAIFVFIRGYGSIEFENEMKVRAEKLGVINNTRFVSIRITPEEMAVYLNMADVFISIPKTDQFGSSIMEGMACGAIPIVSDIKVYGQYLEDGKNAFFVNPEKTKEVAEQIINCIEHPELKEKFYKINRKIIEEKEDWNKNAKKMEELYEKLLKERIQK